ncbi:hypothetical protein SPHINGO8BC_51084 [Sphingobacterium multivorum]|uniref:Uncharacterized protein n=1 Tax=Sphingobacterium multivorum TaxID=28454 RepID=A0A654CPX9_SPHMU|nr:hypothetical protein SPHINGO8BC_51084 [Sphingobacterium multivorum]
MAIYYNIDYLFFALVDQNYNTTSLGTLFPPIENSVNGGNRI